MLALTGCVLAALALKQPAGAVNLVLGLALTTALGLLVLHCGMRPSRALAAAAAPAHVLRAAADHHGVSATGEPCS